MRSPASLDGGRTLGRDLERRRLEHRAHRIELVLDALRRLQSTHADGRRRQPAQLRRAIASFEDEPRGDPPFTLVRAVGMYGFAGAPPLRRSRRIP